MHNLGSVSRNPSQVGRYRSRVVCNLDRVSQFQVKVARYPDEVVRYPAWESRFRKHLGQCREEGVYVLHGVIEVRGYSQAVSARGGHYVLPL